MIEEDLNFDEADIREVIVEATRHLHAANLAGGQAMWGVKLPHLKLQIGGGKLPGKMIAGLREQLDQRDIWVANASSSGHIQVKYFDLPADAKPQALAKSSVELLRYSIEYRQNIAVGRLRHTLDILSREEQNEFA